MSPRQCFLLKNCMLLANMVSNLIGAVGVNGILLRGTRGLTTELAQTYTKIVEPIFTPVMFAAAIVATLLYEQPIRRFVNRCDHTGAQPPAPEAIQRRVLNEPFFAVLLDLAIWVFVAIFWALLFYYLGEPSMVIQGSFVHNMSIGLITSTVAFFVLEHVLQREMAPFFFPDGQLYSVRRTLRVSIRVRLAAFLLGCNLVPFVTLLLFYTQIVGAGKDPVAALDRVGTSLLINSFIFIVVGLWLWFLVGSNLSRPLRDIIETLKKVRSGNLDDRVHVTSNDEIGYAGDVINQMTLGLKEREHLRLSMLLAREVQQNLLPIKPPVVSGLDLAAVSRYCDETGGDYYDFLKITDGQGYRTGVVVGDVSGHGISSALLMATARASLRQRVSLPGSLESIVADVNYQLYRDVAASGQFMTLFALLFDLDQRRIEWVRAGHEPALLYDPLKDQFDVLSGSGLPLGVDDAAHYAIQRRTGLTEGTIVLLGTDGIWETFNARGEMFGKERLYPIIRAHAGSAAGVIRDHIMDALQAFRRGAALEDDVTLVIAKLDRYHRGADFPP